MDHHIDRRRFLACASAATLAPPLIVLGASEAPAGASTDGAPDRPHLPRQDPEVVRQVVGASHRDLEMVKSLEAKVFIPAHAEATENIAPLAQLNIDKVYEIAQKIRLICAAPATFESVLQQLFTAFGLTMNMEQYVLVGSTVRSYLAWLSDTDQAEYFFEDGQMLWRAKA